VLATAAPGAFVEVRDPAGIVVVRGPTVGRFSHERPRLPYQVGGLESAGEPGAAFFTVDSSQHGGSEFRVRAERFTDGSLLMVALSLDDVHSTLDRLVVIEVVVTAAVLLGAVAMGWWLVRVGLRPLGGIETTAASIAGGELTARMPQGNERTEVGRLAMALNTMLQRIEDAFTKQQTSEERLRRFVADASHELRTPVSAVGAYAELFERGAQQRPDDLARVLRGVRVETARMQALIEDLLLLTRLDEGRPLEHQPVELVALAGESVEAAQMIGSEWPLSIEADEPVEVIGDRMALREVLDNLLANVRAHTPPAHPRPCACGPATATPSSRWPTKVRVSPRTTPPACSNASTEPTRRAPGIGEAQDSGWPSWPHWSRRTAGGSTSTRAPARARPSACTCPSRPSAVPEARWVPGYVRRVAKTMRAQRFGELAHPHARGPCVLAPLGLTIACVRGHGYVLRGREAPSLPGASVDERSPVHA
jgi:signal transduction histidine kinase